MTRLSILYSTGLDYCCFFRLIADKINECHRKVLWLWRSVKPAKRLLTKVIRQLKWREKYNICL